MAPDHTSFHGSPSSRMYREQILTTDDLSAFKLELLDEIGKLLKQHRGESAKKWLKSPDVRKLLGISPGTLQNLRVNGTLPYTKVGGVIFYDSEDIRKMLEANRSQNSLAMNNVRDRPQPGKLKVY